MDLDGMAGRKQRDTTVQDPLADAKALDWDEVRLLVEIARARSLRAAAKNAKLTVNTLRRRLQKLEDSLGAPLLTRHVDGVRLTPVGERALAAARRMERAYLELARDPRVEEAGLGGDVKIATTEGLSSLWIVPNLVELQRRYPDRRVDLHAGMAPVDVLRLEADISVQITRPDARDLKVLKIARMHTMPFASPAYIEAHGKPKSFADLRDHKMILQVAPQVPQFSEFMARAGMAHLAGSTVIRTNSSSTHFAAVLNGAGLGMLPTYTHAFGAQLVPVDLDYHPAHDIWLTYHPGAARIGRVRLFVDWLVEIFSPRRYPWFADAFVHPRDIPVLTELPRIFGPVDEGVKSRPPAARPRKPRRSRS